MSDTARQQAEREAGGNPGGGRGPREAAKSENPPTQTPGEK